MTVSKKLQGEKEDVGSIVGSKMAQWVLQLMIQIRGCMWCSGVEVEVHRYIEKEDRRGVCRIHMECRC